MSIRRAAEDVGPIGVELSRREEVAAETAFPSVLPIREFCARSSAHAMVFWLRCDATAQLKVGRARMARTKALL